MSIKNAGFFIPLIMLLRTSSAGRLPPGYTDPFTGSVCPMHCFARGSPQSEPLTLTRGSWRNEYREKEVYKTSKRVPDSNSLHMNCRNSLKEDPGLWRMDILINPLCPRCHGDLVSLNSIHLFDQFVTYLEVVPSATQNLIFFIFVPTILSGYS